MVTDGAFLEDCAMRGMLLWIACLVGSVAASDCSAQVVYAPSYGYGGRGYQVNRVWTPPGTVYSRGRFAALPYVTPYSYGGGYGGYARGYGGGGWGPNTRAWARFEEVEALRGIEAAAWSRGRVK